MAATAWDRRATANGTADADHPVGSGRPTNPTSRVAHGRRGRRAHPDHAALGKGPAAVRVADLVVVDRAATTTVVSGRPVSDPPRRDPAENPARPH